MVTLAIALGYVFMTALSVVIFWRYRQGSPIFWYPLALALMAVGTFPMTDLDQNSDFTYITLFFAANLSFIFSAAVYLGANNVALALSNFAASPALHETSSQRTITKFLFFLSAGISVLYFYLVGYNVLFLLLSGNIAGDYSTLRLESYSGDIYFAPGYVNQFKNVLLPITGVAVCVWFRQTGRRESFIILSLLVAIFTLAMLAGTGQRAYVLFALVALGFGFVLYGIGRPSVVRRSHILLAAVPVLLLFAFMTGGYAEIDDASEGAVLAKVLERFTSIQQEGALVGFRYIYTLPISWFAEWKQGFSGIMPGVEGSTLPNEIHAIMYGTFRGTVPLSVIGSAYYNGGVLGVILLFTCLGLIYAALYHRFLLGERTLLRSLVYGSLFFYLTIYVSDAPTILVDNGVVSLMLFLVLLRFSASRRSQPNVRSTLATRP